jgi:hypothetical protein
MPSSHALPFIDAITSRDAGVRDRALEELAAGSSPHDLLQILRDLDQFRAGTDNLYERVRAAMFCFGICRFLLPAASGLTTAGTLPPQGYEDLMARRFGQAIAHFHAAMARTGPTVTLCSALAKAYHHLAFQILSDQVRQSVRACAGNQWMFRVGHADDHPLRIHSALLARAAGSPLYPILAESTPVRLDLSHSGWSDIFFLGMDYPAGARVLNIAVDLGVHGRDADSRPPVETFLRVIPEPLLRLTSMDLRVSRDLTDLDALFDFGSDYLSLLKAGIIAAGIIPPSFEGTRQSLAAALACLIGPGMGLELVTAVRDIPKGSRLAVSTHLLASIISLCMRATQQIGTLTGGMTDRERRLVASRAILGEWLGGSGGGWQDSGGIWPGVKLIQGAGAQPGDPEYGISAGCLLPTYQPLTGEALHPDFAPRLQDSLVLIHGGLAQNVGPILEMATEKYLLRSSREWHARHDARALFDGIVGAVRTGDIRALAQQTQRNWDGPLKTIIPWVTSAFTEAVIAGAQRRLGDDFWGFLMLGGMSGGGMGLFVAPAQAARYRDALLELLLTTKRQFESALPFATDPVVYTFAVNEQGSVASLRHDTAALMPDGYYALLLPGMATYPEGLTEQRRTELTLVSQRLMPVDAQTILQSVVTSLFRPETPASPTERQAWSLAAEGIKSAHGFDAAQHEGLRADLRSGRLGLAHNRLPVETDITDVRAGDVTLLSAIAEPAAQGVAALQRGAVAVMTLAAGVGSRWTHGSGVIKAINPFVVLGGAHRSFLEIHLRKTQRASARYGAPLPHIVSTSFLTHAPVADYLAAHDSFGCRARLYLSPGQSIGQRLVPMARDLQFLWEELPQELLDEQKQKVREALRRAHLVWARAKGEGTDYLDNLPRQRFTPPGHWYEVPNLLRNGVLAQLLTAHPQVETLMLHNVDTLGADLDPAALDYHLRSGNTLTFEVVPRRVGDLGGGLARVNGRVRLLEGLAQPRELDDLNLRYYNTMTTWIQIDPLLALFGLTRADLHASADALTEAVRATAQRLPTYTTIKEVKYRWGYGQEDIHLVAQFEKLWGDMSALPDVACGYLGVPIQRGQQLKDPDELDHWTHDGSQAYIAALCGLDGEGPAD